MCPPWFAQQLKYGYKAYYKSCERSECCQQHDSKLYSVRIATTNLHQYRDTAPSDEELSTYRKAWQRDRLALARNNLLPPWKEIYENLVKEIGEPNSLDCLFQIQERFESGCPKRKEEFKGMSINEIADFLKNWISSDD